MPPLPPASRRGRADQAAVGVKAALSLPLPMRWIQAIAAGVHPLEPDASFPRARRAADRFRSMTDRTALYRAVREGQCASSQFTAARASTFSGTFIDSAGMEAFSMTSTMTGMVLSTSPSSTSKISSS